MKRHPIPFPNYLSFELKAATLQVKGKFFVRDYNFIYINAVHLILFHFSLTYLDHSSAFAICFCLKYPII